MNETDYNARLYEKMKADWQEDGVKVSKGAKSLSILEPVEYAKKDGSTGIAYNVKKVFDVSQTNGRSLFSISSASPHRTVFCNSSWFIVFSFPGGVLPQFHFCRRTHRQGREPSACVCRRSKDSICNRSPQGCIP